mmetsp:Transcript_109399/g.189585  ORF Transcript_109399/g.189585 Transcript_109399/m.189585 type:complete len:96 (+) Transcript_109399:293-580(+)
MLPATIICASRSRVMVCRGPCHTLTSLQKYTSRTHMISCCIYLPPVHATTRLPPSSPSLPATLVHLSHYSEFVWSIMLAVDTISNLRPQVSGQVV